MKKILYKSDERAILFAKLSVPYNAAMALGKIIIGIFSFSVFLIINALYNVGMGLIKCLAVKAALKIEGIKDGKICAPEIINEPCELNKQKKSNEPYLAKELNKPCPCVDVKKSRLSSEDKQQTEFFMIAGGILFITSIVYIIYTVRMFVGEKSMNYSMNIALAIACVTFTEIVVAIRGIVKTRKNKKPIMEAIKLVNLASALISLVLTQTAIMSFSHEGDASFYNGLSGLIFGSIAALIGIYMVIRAGITIKKHNLKTEIQEKKS